MGCVADDRPLLAVSPAPLKVDVTRLKDATHELSSARTRGRFKGLYTDCEIGAMPPLGPLYRQEVVVEETLADDRDIVFDAGSHREAIRMRYAEFERLVRPTVAAFGIGTRRASTEREQQLRTDAVCGPVSVKTQPGAGLSTTGRVLSSARGLQDGVRRQSCGCTLERRGEWLASPKRSYSPTRIRRAVEVNTRGEVE